jgi:hypothetical protein
MLIPEDGGKYDSTVPGNRMIQSSLWPHYGGPPEIAVWESFLQAAIERLRFSPGSI